MAAQYDCCANSQWIQSPFARGLTAAPGGPSQLLDSMHLDSQASQLVAQVASKVVVSRWWSAGGGQGGNKAANRRTTSKGQTSSPSVPTKQFWPLVPIQPFRACRRNFSAANFGFAILSDIEAYFLIQAAQGNTRGNIMQAPKVTLFNGQNAYVSDTTTTFCNQCCSGRG